ncbi:MAG TPA: glycosyltransferase family 4 protein [Candidatus Dormibacteraeota bacterium]|jgi:glycosyltransferase involved in cell wall biosynthesis|nr:glycosyltransferase family 4 protein [Candidatus Dormibacteraeota bacterium]
MTASTDEVHEAQPVVGSQRLQPGQHRPHRIAIVAPPWYPVPPTGYGGIELVVAMLAEQLRGDGLDVPLLAGEGSRMATHIAAPPQWRADLGGRRECVRALTYASRVMHTLEELGPLDLIHDHCGGATLFALSTRGIAPVIHTVHGPLGDPDADFYAALPRSTRLVAISEAQRATAPSLPWVATVHNAVDLDQLAVSGDGERDDDGYLLCLARICYDKGQDVALEVAARTGMRLVLAGKVEATPEGRSFFEHCVEPAIDGDRVVYLPNVAGQAKTRLLSRATALLAPLRWEEPFGLNLVEAMASGTPAIAFARGAAPELLGDGVTGFLVDDVDGMVDAVSRVDEIDRRACAAATRERFSPAAMARAYRAAYAATVGSSRLAVAD